MSLAITDQEGSKTVSRVDVADICAALGIGNMSEAAAYYSISGTRQASLRKGFNIVRYTDGTARKVWVR